MTLTYVVAIVKPMWSLGITTFVNSLLTGQSIELVREWNNRYDPNAVGVWINCQSGRMLIGYLEKTMAEVVAVHLEHGHSALSELLEDAATHDTISPAPKLKIQVKPRP